MRFSVSIVAVLAGVVAAGDMPASTVTVTSSVTVTSCPVSSKVAPVSVSSCDLMSETCTMTVTRPLSWGTGGPWAPPKNSTTAAAVGTGTPVKPAPSYYSNAASSLQGGAVAIGAGLLAMLAL